MQAGNPFFPQCLQPSSEGDSRLEFVGHMVHELLWWMSPVLGTQLAAGLEPQDWQLLEPVFCLDSFQLGAPSFDARS